MLKYLRVSPAELGVTEIPPTFASPPEMLELVEVVDHILDGGFSFSHFPNVRVIGLDWLAFREHRAWSGGRFPRLEVVAVKFNNYTSLRMGADLPHIMDRVRQTFANRTFFPALKAIHIVKLNRNGESVENTEAWEQWVESMQRFGIAVKDVGSDHVS